MHLRNTLAKGMDAESYSLHTFEALLSQSMENLGESWQKILTLYNFFYNLSHCLSSINNPIASLYKFQYISCNWLHFPCLIKFYFVLPSQYLYITHKLPEL